MSKKINILFEYNPDLLSTLEDEKEEIKTDEEPITPVDQMSTQLSVEAPPIEDSNYVPATPKELGNAVSVISMRCPDDQVEFFYRAALALIEKAIDKSRKVPENVFIPDDEELKTPINVQKEGKNRVVPTLVDYIIDVNKKQLGESMSARNKDFARKWKQGDDLRLGSDDVQGFEDDDIEFHPDAEDLLDFMQATGEDDASNIYGASEEAAEEANREYSLQDILKSKVYPGAGRESAIHNKIERDMFQPLRMTRSAPNVSDALTKLIKSDYGVDAFLDSLYHADLLSDSSLDELRKNPDSVHGSSLYGYFTSIAFVRPTVRQLEKLAEMGPDVFDFKRNKSQIDKADAEKIIDAVKAAWERKNASQKSKIATKAATQMGEFEARDKSVMG